MPPDNVGDGVIFLIRATYEIYDDLMTDEDLKTAIAEIKRFCYQQRTTYNNMGNALRVEEVSDDTVIEVQP